MFVNGEANPDLTLAINDLLAACPDLPSKKERTHETAHRPFSAAEYFTFVFSLILRYIVGMCFLIISGWNEDLQECYPEGGVFNHIRNFAARIEEQIDGTLHAHWILWCWNLCTSQKEIRRKTIEDPDFSNEVMDWLDQIKGLNSPILSKYANTCPTCGSALEPIPPTIAMYRKGKKNNGPPLTCKCLTCHEKFSSYELNLLYVDKYARENGIEKDEYCAKNIDIWSASCEHLDITIPFQMIVFTIALMDLQFHYWHHAKYVQTPYYLARVLNVPHGRHLVLNVGFFTLDFFNYCQPISTR
jgi:hypothetical protein